MADNDDSTVVIAAIGLVLAVVIAMLAWVFVGNGRVTTTDNCPVEYKTK